jgi:beta-glucosidase
VLSCSKILGRLIHALISFGPDPYLNGEGAFETIVGVQSVGVMACAKHFIANNQEHWRYGISANIGDRTLHEIYFYPFLRSIEVRASFFNVAYVPNSMLGSQ